MGDDFSKATPRPWAREMRRRELNESVAELFGYQAHVAIIDGPMDNHYDSDGNPTCKWAKGDLLIRRSEFGNWFKCNIDFCAIDGPHFGPAVKELLDAGWKPSSDPYDHAVGIYTWSHRKRAPSEPGSWSVDWDHTVEKDNDLARPVFGDWVDGNPDGVPMLAEIVERLIYERASARKLVDDGSDIITEQDDRILALNAEVAARDAAIARAGAIEARQHGGLNSTPEERAMCHAYNETRTEFRCALAPFIKEDV